MACVKLGETEETVESLKKELETLKNEVKEKTVMVKSKSPDYPLMFIWKIDNFSKLVREAKDGVNERQTCAPFYTENYGYKFEIYFYPNGYGFAQDTFLSVFLVIKKGEYDALLPWPFKRKVNFTLLDQQENLEERENHSREITPSNDLKGFGRPVEKRMLGYGIPEFISHEKLERGHYVVDDTLFLQCEVGPPS